MVCDNIYVRLATREIVKKMGDVMKIPLQENTSTTSVACEMKL